MTQGDRTVAEYEEEFTRLVNFVLDVVNMEEKRIVKFLGGLDWRIRQHLLGNPVLLTFVDAMNAAFL